MDEGTYKSELKKKIETLFPGCIILKNDASQIQGIPDLSIFYGPKYAMLETKRSKYEHKRPNQEYYVEYVNNMSYASFVYPENEQQVLQELYIHFKAKGETKNEYVERSS